MTLAQSDNRTDHCHIHAVAAHLSAAIRCNLLHEIDNIKQVMPRLVSDETDIRHKLMSADWLLRTHLPACLRAGGLNDIAHQISSRPGITNWDHVASLAPLTSRAKDAACGAWSARLESDRLRSAPLGVETIEKQIVSLGKVIGGAISADPSCSQDEWNHIREEANTAAWFATNMGNRPMSPTLFDLKQSAVDLLFRMTEIK